MTKQDYMQLPYNINVKYHDYGDEKYYVAKVSELKGCKADGETPEQAVANLRAVMDMYIDASLEHGDYIPVPIGDDKEFSGAFNVRVPATVHRAIVLGARKEHTSMNQLFLYLITSNPKFQQYL